MSKYQIIDITDTLIEYGPGTIDPETESKDYIYVKFQEKGRVPNFKILRSAQSEFESMLGVENVRFLWIDGKDIKMRRSGFLTAFENKEKSYLIDILDNEIHGDQTYVTKKIKKWLSIARIAFGILALCFIIFIPLSIALAFLSWLSHKKLSQLNSFINCHNIIKNQFSHAEKI